MITNVTNSAGSWAYRYDAIDQLTQEVFNTTGITAWVYDEAGNRLAEKSTGVTNYSAYNDGDELLWMAPSTNVFAVTGTVDPGPKSNKWYDTWVTVSDHSKTRVATNSGAFSVNRVPVHEGSNSLWATARDVSGNVSATQTVSFWMESDSLETLFWHDPNGNLATQMWQGVTMLYRYDRENRLTKVTSNGVTVLECWYDGQGRRLAKREVAGGQTNVTQYVYDGWTVLAVLNQNGEMIEAYTRGSGIAGDIGTIVAETKFSGGAATNTYYYHNNHRGDVTAVRSTNGTTLATWDYRPFGEERSATGSLNPRYRFSSKEYDASVGLYYYGYRHYSVALCRWLQEDAAPDRTERSTHAFVGNCPISKIDAYGLRASTTSSKSGVDDWYDPIQTINEFCKAYHDMVEANTIGADRYFHCMAHCNAAKKGGGGAALCLGLIREGCDNVRNACTKKNRPLRQCLDSLGDIAANLHGLHVAEHENCRDRCAIYRPPGLAAKY